MAFHLYTGNRMELLAEALARVVERPLSSPFHKEVIVVQSKGMQRWLAMELARKFGIWANCDYPFPNEMVWRIFRALNPDLPDSSSFSPHVTTWKLMGLLPGLLHLPQFTPLRHYLAGGESLKLLQLCMKIADTFDQYSLFRPEMLLEWEAGAEGEWQAVLWRHLAESTPGMHRGRVKEEFCRLAAHVPLPAEGLPARISLFGISYLPGYHLDVLAAAGRLTEINLFLLNPTREYWGDIVSPREKARRPVEQRTYLTEGNRLLASLGKLGRDFGEQVVDTLDMAFSQEEFHRDPGHDSLLTKIQSDILNLRNSRHSAGSEPSSVDDSLQIHSCHSPLREMEVLHDQLLELFATRPDLNPRDVVVMTPDIEAYAPYITAVFDGCQDPSRRIPFSIADRRLSSEGEIAGVLLQLLALPGSRMSVPQLFDLLETPAVKRRFGLSDSEMDIIRTWLEETRVRWGIGADDRLRFGLPPYAENSWSAGLDRLLLGYAMREEGGELFNGILPYGDLEGGVAPTLGKLAAFVAGAEAVAEALRAPRPLNEWCQTLRHTITDFTLSDDDSAGEMATIVALIDALGDSAGEARFTQPVDLTVIRQWMTVSLDREEKGLGFLTGGVTFCAMLPMRSIPFRVVALVGMNDGAFPRQGRPPGFDLIARHPRAGDRSLRDEDRYLFLEALLSARDVFYLSYVGQSIRDNSEIPPSVLVSELLDAVDFPFCSDSGEKIPLVTKHRLQAFSPDYFTPGHKLFSYSRENWEALTASRHEPWIPRPFIHPPLALPEGEARELPLPSLLRFYDNPSRYFLENRLRIRLDEASTPLEEREPFAVQTLDAYALRQELLELVLSGVDPASCLPQIRCRGILPPAGHGEILFQSLVTEVTTFAASLRQHGGDLAPLPPLDICLERRGFRLTGRLDRIMPEQMLRYRCAGMKPKDRLRSWIEHLILNIVAPPEYPRRTLLHMTDGTCVFYPVPQAGQHLDDLLDLLARGMTEPLPFFPASSLEYAHKLEWRLDRARKAWTGGYGGWAEKDDPAFSLCFGELDPFDDRFDVVARLLLEPLIRHQGSLKGGDHHA